MASLGSSLHSSRVQSQAGSLSSRPAAHPACAKPFTSLPSRSVNSRACSSCCQPSTSSSVPPLAHRHQRGQSSRLSRSQRVLAASAATMEAASSSEAPSRCYVTTSVTATTVEAFIAEIQEAVSYGVDIVELRLDFIKDFDTERDLQRIMSSCPVPYIVTYRPKWEGGNYKGPEAPRLATLKFAALQGAPYIDVELKAASVFFAGAGEVPISTKVILSSHNFECTPDAVELRLKAREMVQAGADIVKIATMANDICDCAAVLSLLQDPVAPTIALAMGERGQITRLLAAKYGGYLTFAALSPAKASAPGQPTIQQLLHLYNLRGQSPETTKLFGIIGNPVSQSKSPLIHNNAFQHIGFDGVYVPLLVDDLEAFLKAFKGHDFHGFSVTIPHKEAALRLAHEVDPVVKQIGACNTLVRQPDNTFKGYNTDWSAAISAIERQLASAAGQTSSSSSSSSGSSPLQGKTFVVIGAGGAGRALAFGAASKGARVIVANRSLQRAEELVARLGGAPHRAVRLEELQAGRVAGEVLANSTSVGMVPKTEESPVPAGVLGQFSLVFDAVYNPLWTRLLLDAKAAGCLVVDGLQMFVGQAVDQFTLFTGGRAAPVEVMEGVLLHSMGQKK